MHSVKSSGTFAHSRLIISKILDLREKFTGRQMFVSVFYSTSVRNTEYLAIYVSDACQNAFRSSYRLSVLTGTGLCRKILIKRPNIKFHENSLNDLELLKMDRITFLQLFASNLPKIGEEF
jgi:hypothetical protein